MAMIRNNNMRLNGRGLLCESCGGQTAKKKVKKQHWLHGKLYIIENVEAEVCSECGERYFHAKTLDEIDRLLETAHEVTDRIEVEVVRL
jgi:YgiT-type zinc finger domain-containing protein